MILVCMVIIAFVYTTMNKPKYEMIFDGSTTNLNSSSTTRDKPEGAFSIFEVEKSTDFVNDHKSELVKLKENNILTIEEVADIEAREKRAMETLKRLEQLNIKE